MGIWAEIKHALNSTLGTSEFKPLDKLIEGYLLRNKTFIGSDNTLLKWSEHFSITSPSTSGSTKRTIGTFKPYISGFANIDLAAYLDNNDVAYLNFVIYEDGVLKYSETSYNEDSTKVAFSFTDLSFSQGKLYTFELQITRRSSYGGSAHFNHLFLNADIVDGFPYDYTIGG